MLAARSDPPVPADGCCIVCGKPRRTAGLKPLYREAMKDDPFCSTSCSRQWWGTQLAGTKRGGLQDAD